MSDGIYIHIPFCRTKCPYCAFASRPCTGDPPEWYIDAVIRQAARMADYHWVRQRRFATLFIGGGTPTIYSGHTLARLIKACRDLFRLEPDAEISVEANPNTVSELKLCLLKDAGVNRLSLGVQTMEERLLAGIGRSHSRTEAIDAFRAAQAAGFGNCSLDLIYGLPGQQLGDLVATLETAVGLAPQHISLYELMVEEGTPFSRQARRGELILPTEDTVVAMEEAAYSLLDQCGYQRYEIANFSRPGFACRHNINYWLNGSYLGLGAGVVSSFAGLRIRSVADPELFRNLVNAGLPPFSEAECLAKPASFRETVIMGLRMTAGIELGYLEKRFGIFAPAYYGATLDELVSQGLLIIEAGRLRLTAQGLPLANQALARLV
ncbi:MAG: hypothetical protein A2511_06665 [Deltaproteobacteria bacterium RIFOXYD12_FULL_50_9]|nr:MAG: hypothetical protein A2511_06665 [Deltaproteobacteria bacterium RIFOXYD12_FULL_50_9]